MAENIHNTIKKQTSNSMIIHLKEAKITMKTT